MSLSPLDDGMQLWVAEADGRIVSAGRLESVRGTDFAGIWGGATREEWRGRGIYRALTAARARSALDRQVAGQQRLDRVLSSHPRTLRSPQSIDHDPLPGPALRPDATRSPMHTPRPRGPSSKSFAVSTATTLRESRTETDLHPDIRQVRPRTHQ